MTNSIVTPTIEVLGYRPLGPRPGEAPDRANQLASVASKARYAFDVQNRSGVHFLRRTARRTGVAPEPLLNKIEELTAATWMASTAGNSRVRALIGYENSLYGKKFATQLKVGKQECLALISSLSSGTEPIYKRVTAFQQALAFAPAENLQQIVESALDTFFSWQPHGCVITYRVSSDFEAYLGFLRAAYAYEHVGPNDFQGLKTDGFASLREWQSMSAIGSARAILTQLDHFFYPFVTGFQGGPLGLILHFLLGEPEEQETGRYMAAELECSTPQSRRLWKRVTRS